MTQTILNPDIITAEALRILHQRCNFLGSINRQYDNSFANEGAKIGTSLRIRLPNQYTVRTGAPISVQETVETNTSLTVATQKGVDVSFSSVELTMQLDDFSQRILAPAMTVLAANIEADALSMYKDVYNQVNGHGAAQTFRNVLLGRKSLIDNLAPYDDQQHCRLNTQDNVDMVDSLKGLFQPSSNVAAQNRDGVLGRTAGFEFAENTFLGQFTRGAEDAAYLTNQVADQVGTDLIVDTGAGAGLKGDVFTIASVFRVHPETKASTGVLQQFVLTADYAGGAGTMKIAPEIVATGARQNVSNGAQNNKALVFAGTLSTASGVSLAYHKDAFTFATADLVLPGGVDMAARKVLDGISMRLVRQYTISTDLFPARFDVLYGYKTLRPQLAVRLAAN